MADSDHLSAPPDSVSRHMISPDRRAPTAIELFCGAGGLSLGLKAAGYDVLLASDIDPAAARTHKKAFGASTFALTDVRSLTKQAICKRTGLRGGELDLLAGGPPCQGFSIIGSRRIEDPRNDLFQEYLRIADELQPRALLMENVPGMLTLAGGRALARIVQGFQEIRYRVSFAELLAAQYGVPQLRWRLVFVAFRKDIDLESGMGFPKPSHGHAAIGALIPNCTIPPEDLDGFVTTREAIGDLPSVEPGRLTAAYTGRPECDYQRVMRAGLTTELYNHYAPRLSARNLKRIAALKAGQDWRDLPTHLLPAGMRRALRKDHTRRYRRMMWRSVPRAIITRFRDPKSGEYTHPDQDRTISIREAARIQSFPDSFAFEGTNSQIYDQVGNAVPPMLAQAVGREIRMCLEGRARHRLSRPFARRPGVRWDLLRQTRLAFDPL